MLEKVKRLIRPILEKYRTFRQLRKLHDPVFVDGFPESRNFGDALNVFFVKYLSGRAIFPARLLAFTRYKNETSYGIIGSVCQMSRPQSIIWGAGFIGDRFVREHFVFPSKVLAVRGPLSRAVYRDKGIACPEIYGDPALLLPLIYDPPVSPAYDYGIIPHYVDWNAPWVEQYRGQSNILVINIMIKDDYVLFVKQLKSCRHIVSSSLHGLILAHAYRIPAVAIKLSEEVTGGDFKFNDYLLSVGKQTAERIDPHAAGLDVTDLTYDKEPINIDLAPLIQACPFIGTAPKQHLLDRCLNYYG